LTFSDLRKRENDRKTVCARTTWSCFARAAGNKYQTVEIQVTLVGPDLQFATAEVARSTAEGLGSASDGPSAASSAFLALPRD
jgi:hypothetical protein